MKPQIFLILITLVVTGCTTTHKETLPPELLYQQPPSSGQTATIQGSLKPRYNKIVGDRIAYIINIDGKRLPLDKKQQYKHLWNNPYTISAGEHTITTQYNMAGWFTEPIKITFTAEANHQYQLDFVTDIGTSFNSGNTYADVWIIDKATNKPVSEVVRGLAYTNASNYSTPIIIHNTHPIVIHHR